MKKKMSDIKTGLSLLNFSSQTRGTYVIMGIFLAVGTLFTFAPNGFYAPFGGFYFALVSEMFLKLPFVPMSSDLCRMSYKRKEIVTKVQCKIMLATDLILATLYLGITVLNFVIRKDCLDGMTVTGPMSGRILLTACAFLIVGIGTFTSEKSMLSIVILTVLVIGMFGAGSWMSENDIVRPMNLGILAAILYGSIIFTVAVVYLLSLALYRKDDFVNKVRQNSMQGMNV